MPNWVENTLTVKLPTKDADRFKEAVRGRMWDATPEEVLCAHKIIPYPKEFLDRDNECRQILGATGSDSRSSARSAA